MSPLQIVHAYALSNLVALLILVVCWRWKTAGRLSLALLFLWAGIYNLRMVFVQPEAYLTYARFAHTTGYQEFILGFFKQHTTAIVAGIAIGQLLIAILVSLRARAVYVGLVGAIIFLVAIAPLGTAAAFPATLIAAIGAVLLLRHTYASGLQRELSGALGLQRVTV